MNGQPDLPQQQQPPRPIGPPSPQVMFANMMRSLEMQVAKDIYVEMIMKNPKDWDKQKMAREAIESAKQFVQALQFEQEGISSGTEIAPGQGQRPGAATGSTSPSSSPHATHSHPDEHTTTGTHQDEHKGKARQRHSDQGTG